MAPKPACVRGYGRGAVKLWKKVSLLFLLGTSAAFGATGCRTTATRGSTLEDAGVEIGGLKGAKVIETIVKGRMLSADGGKDFLLTQFIGDPNEKGLASILGGYTGSLSDSSLVSVTPNTVNVILWHLTMRRLAEHFATLVDAAITTPISPSPLNDQYMAAAKPFLAPLPASAIERRPLLKNLWLSVMRFDAPQTEMNAWIEAVAAESAFVQLSPKDALAILLETIFEDPYFLLAH